MKRFLLAAAIILATVACSKEEGNGNYTPDTSEIPKEISVSPETLEIGRSGGTLTLFVTAPSRPRLSSAAAWIKVTDGTYSNYTLNYKLSVEAYNEYGSREATLTVTSGRLSETVVVKQKGMDAPNLVETDITKDLVTPGATASAKALYEYLYGIYGQKTVSAVMADVNWNTKVADKVNQQTGKYPAMNCFDFIHIYVPDGNGWINYKDLTPVTSWHDAGGIVSLMWHFNVPISESTTVGSNGSGVTCNPGQTSFKASNALKDGTWEHTWYEQEINKVADIILQLQEQGIAAIWRPYHEAAGNYHALQWKGSAWFWWGAEGPEVFKSLWKDMFDRFAEKGIRNLIWVWTAQNYNGDMSAYDNDAAWYPGDAKVDVVARDLYGSDAEANGVEFVLLQNAYPHKMITLGECGWGNDGANPFAALKDFWAAGAKWSWFMPWYADGFTMVDAAWWKAAFAENCVITLDELPTL